jgi:molybdopterin/thiamine biosynthesis adenylyltransferase
MTAEYDGQGEYRRGPARADRPVELRIEGGRFAAVRAHVEDTRRGEEAGVLICGVGRLRDRDVLLAREWIPVPDDAVTARGNGYALSWNATFTGTVLARADALGGALVLIHTHEGSAAPTLSPPDLRSAAELFAPISRVLAGRPCGSVVLGADAAAGRFWCNGLLSGSLDGIRVVGTPLQSWRPNRLAGATPVRARLDRQNQALGRRSDALLAAAHVAIVGVCGGGAHVCQQLAHLGVGTMTVVDDELVAEANLNRMVGATPRDIERVHKTAVMRRLIRRVDPSIRVHEVRLRFPADAAIRALKEADVVVSCVDTFSARDEINAFCRRYHLPLVDVGMTIITENERLRIASGQVVLALPGSPCLRCTPLLADEVLERERREQPLGYDRNPEAVGAPQVISMNGVLASEAANCVLDLIAGYSGGARGTAWWGYDGRRGDLVRCDLPRRQDCPACAQSGHGDPLPASGP